MPLIGLVNMMKSH